MIYRFGDRSIMVREITIINLFFVAIIFPQAFHAEKSSIQSGAADGRVRAAPNVRIMHPQQLGTGNENEASSRPCLIKQLKFVEMRNLPCYSESAENLCITIT